MKYKSMLIPIIFIFMISLPASKAEAGQGKSLVVLSDTTIRERQLFIEERLDTRKKHAVYWQNGWTGFYSVGTVVQGVLGVTENKNDDRVKNIVGALKSAGALVDVLLRPLPGRYGADKLREMPTDTRTANLNRLDLGEDLLQKSAVRAAERTTWKPHLKVLGVNLLGAALIAGFGDEDDALVSTALGIAVGEAAIWSQPWRPEADLHDYRSRYPRSRMGLHWEIVPTAGGLAITGAF